jgi:hypothetical protein
VVTNDQIRRAQPSIDSPLGKLIKGQISEKQYNREVAEKRSRETPAPQQTTQARHVSR